MTPDKFSYYANDLFGEVLKPYNFSSERSRHCTFYRFASDDVCQVILPDIGTNGNWYDVKVFATSRDIEPLFSDRFPDDLGIPSDLFSYLNSRTGVGPDQEKYHCKSLEGLQRNFDKKVKSALIDKAIPFLDGITTVSDIIPCIKSNIYLGLALSHVGKTDEANLILRSEKERLVKLNSNDKLASAFLDRIEELL